MHQRRIVNDILLQRLRIRSKRLHCGARLPFSHGSIVKAAVFGLDAGAANNTYNMPLIIHYRHCGLDRYIGILFTFKRKVLFGLGIFGFKSRLNISVKRAVYFISAVVEMLGSICFVIIMLGHKPVYNLVYNRIDKV